MKIEPPLAICGRGAVSAAGLGVGSWIEGGEPRPERMASLNGSGTDHPVFRVDLKREPLARWQGEARTRRASPITIFMLEAAHQALMEAGDLDRSTLGIVAES